MALPAAASVVSSGLSAYPTVYYEKSALKTLRSNLFLYGGCETRNMPNQAGVATQIYDYAAFTANTTAATEGTPGAGQALTQNVRTITLSQYVDWISFSDKVVKTAISDTVAQGSAELGFRGALSVDTVISTTLDTAANSDSATRIEIADGSYMTAAKARTAVWALRAVNVQPKADGLFYGVLPSVMAFDLLNDNSAGGAADLQKFADSLAVSNPSLVGIQANRVGNIGGVMWYESNALPTEAHWQSSANVGYHAYVLGFEALIASSLDKADLGQKNFSVKTTYFDQPTAADPASQITAAAAYNFFFGVSKRTGSTNGFRRIRGESSIG
jgi:N4-gp56 family major capsid protein